jgi:hypothetical protein
MIPLVSLFHQESYVSSISKPPLMMSSVFCLQDENMTIQHQITNDVTDDVIDDVVWKTLIHICLLSGFICDCLV